jgi:hypothetical protein
MAERYQLFNSGSYKRLLPNGMNPFHRSFAFSGGRRGSAAGLARSEEVLKKFAF